MTVQWTLIRTSVAIVASGSGSKSLNECRRQTPKATFDYGYPNWRPVSCGDLTALGQIPKQRGLATATMKA